MSIALDLPIVPLPAAETKEDKAEPSFVESLRSIFKPVFNRYKKTIPLYVFAHGTPLFDPNYELRFELEKKHDPKEARVKLIVRINGKDIDNPSIMAMPVCGSASSRLTGRGNFGEKIEGQATTMENANYSFISSQHPFALYTTRGAINYYHWENCMAFNYIAHKVAEFLLGLAEGEVTISNPIYAKQYAQYRKNYQEVPDIIEARCRESKTPLTLEEKDKKIKELRASIVADMVTDNFDSPNKLRAERRRVPGSKNWIKTGGRVAGTEYQAYTTHVLFKPSSESKRTSEDPHMQPTPMGLDIAAEYNAQKRDEWERENKNTNPMPPYPVDRDRQPGILPFWAYMKPNPEAKKRDWVPLTPEQRDSNIFNTPGLVAAVQFNMSFKINTFQINTIQLQTFLKAVWWLGHCSPKCPFPNGQLSIIESTGVDDALLKALEEQDTESSPHKAPPTEEPPQNQAEDSNMRVSSDDPDEEGLSDTEREHRKQVRQQQQKEEVTVAQ